MPRAVNVFQFRTPTSAFRVPILWVLLCWSGAAFPDAQDAVARQLAPPEIEILKTSWLRVRNHPRGIARPGSSASSRPVNERGAGKGSAGSRGEKESDYYIYSAKIKNRGAREIKALAWEYRILDPGSNKELAKHRFWTHTSIGAEQTVTLEGGSVSPPSNVVSVAGLEKNRRSPFVESVVIKCVIYADGSLWRDPSSSEGACERLKKDGND